MIDSDIQASLCDAGIRKDYHNKTLGADYGRVGRGAVHWLVENGSRVGTGGLSVLFDDIGTTAIFTMLAKAFHLRGTSVRIYSLFKFRFP